MYPNMEAVMAQKNISIETIAALLHVHRNTVTNKMSGVSDFTYAEATLMCDALFPEYKPSYIFKRMAS